MPSYCIVCRKGAIKGSVTMHRFPPLFNPGKRQQWLTALNLKPEQVKDYHCVCSRHFRHGDTTNLPSLHLGKRFTSPKKISPRSLRAKKTKSFHYHLVRFSAHHQVHLSHYYLLLFQAMMSLMTTPICK